MHVLLCAPRSDYAFAMTSGEGAILILPDGASRYELQDKQQLEEIREYVKKCALQWCRFSKQGTLYLITTVFKSKSWTLGSFYHGTRGNEILIHRRPCHSSGTDTTGASMYHWECETNVDNPVSPGNNAYLNQTVLLKGFKMTVRWDWLPIVERAERTEWWLVCFFTSLWSTILQRWLSPVGELYSLCHRKLQHKPVHSHQLHPVSEFISGLYCYSDHCMYVQRSSYPPAPSSFGHNQPCPITEGLRSESQSLFHI